LEDNSVRKDFRGKNFGDWIIRVIPNKHPFLGLDSSNKHLGRRGNGLLDRMDGYGAHEVIIECPGPAHLEIADCNSGADAARIERLFWLFKDRMRDLSLNSQLKNFLLFKNYKLEAGASLLHPHCQLTAIPIVPAEIAKELSLSKSHYEEKERCLMCDLITQELELGKRIVQESQNFAVFSPFASRFPGELIIAPAPESHLHVFHLTDDGLVKELARVFIQTLGKLKKVFEDPPYNWVLHSAPVGFHRRSHGETIEQDYHWHFHILPRWTKIAGFEIGGGFYINPLPPESASELLRDA
jgi:UDPglucose--hexose-1-phosphate uridylyltransferase